MYSDESTFCLVHARSCQSEAQQGYEQVQTQGGPEDHQALRDCDGLGLIQWKERERRPLLLAKKLYNEWGEVQGLCGPPPPLHEDPQDYGVSPGWHPLP
jgi:hypothetical protein